MGAPAFPGSPAASLLGWIYAGEGALQRSEIVSRLDMRFSAGNAGAVLYGLYRLRKTRVIRKFGSIHPL